MGVGHWAGAAAGVPVSGFPASWWERVRDAICGPVAGAAGAEAGVLKRRVEVGVWGAKRAGCPVWGVPEGKAGRGGRPVSEGGPVVTREPAGCCAGGPGGRAAGAAERTG